MASTGPSKFFEEKVIFTILKNPIVRFYKYLGNRSCAAGAVVECSTINDAQLAGLSAISYLKDNNSFNFFQDFAHGKYHLICGHTETNVMDVAIIVIMKKDDSLKSEKRKSML